MYDIVSFTSSQQICGRDDALRQSSLLESTEQFAARLVWARTDNQPIPQHIQTMSTNRLDRIFHPRID